MIWLIFPILTVIGYFAEWETVFYVCGTIALIGDIVSFLRGEFVPSAITIQIVLSVIAWIVVGSVWDGILLGGSVWGVIAMLMPLLRL